MPHDPIADFLRALIPACTCGSTFPCQQHKVAARSVTVARPFFFADAGKPVAKA